MARDDYHGVVIEDPYRWLEDLDSPCTRAWVEKQDARALSFLATRTDFQQQVEASVTKWSQVQTRFERVEGGFVLSKEEIPGLLAPRYHFARPGEEPQVLIDPSRLKLAADTAIRYVRPSPDGTLVAFAVGPAGERNVTMRILDVETQELLDDRVEGIKYGAVSWAANSKEFVYMKYRSPGSLDGRTTDRHPIIAKHRIGAAAAMETVLYEPDGDHADFMLGVEVSDDGRLLLVWDSRGRDELLLVADLEDPQHPNWDARLRPALSKRAGHHRYVGGTGATVYVQTSLNAPNQRVVRFTADNPATWETVVSEDERPLQHSYYSGGRLALSYRKDVVTQLEVAQVVRGERESVELPFPGSAFAFRRGPGAGEVSFVYDGFAAPPTGYTLRRSGELSPLGKERDELEEYVTVQRFVESKDGTSVPYFVVGRREDIASPGPTIVYGYGASRAILEPQFDPEWVAWLELGGKLAIANVRGGGEYGERWHKEGRGKNRANAHDDFIAVSEALLASGEARRDELIAYGISNGAMLVGAVMAQRPDLFGGVLADVGVFDALRFPLFTAGPRWASEMGDARKPEEFQWVRQWSPLHRLEDGTCYPATLITTATNDDVVHPSQSFKFAAAMQEKQGCEQPILLRAFREGGHDVVGTAPALVSQRAGARLTFAAIISGL